jgi:hypothetical protein
MAYKIYFCVNFQVNFKCRVRYEDPNSNDLRLVNFFDLYYNETFHIANLNNGYWNNLNMQFDLMNRTFLLNFNYTKVASQPLIKKETLPPDLIKILNFKLRFTFYLNVQFYFGGFEETEIFNTLDLLAQTWIPPQTLEYFLPLFRLLEYWSVADKLSFTGCIRNIKINSFVIDINNYNNLVVYKHVRFDGCPNVRNLCSRNQSATSFKTTRVETVYEGSSQSAFDKGYKAFTEYFYRIVAFNTQGESTSPWILVRTPDSAPTDPINSSWLNASPLSGYKTLVVNISRYCFYCNSKNRNNSIFTGIIQKFVLRISQYNQVNVSDQFHKQFGSSYNAFIFF